MFLPIPKPIRKMLKILRGGVSPVIIFISIVLGFTFGLIPGFSGLHAVLLALVFVLNIHVGLFLLSAALGKALCFAAAPVLYHVGAGVQGYLSGLLRLLAVIPIVGITDFSRYAVAGGIVVGPLVGVVAGLVAAKLVIGFRRGLLRLEDGSEKFKKWYSKTWVRIVDRILIGKRTKDAKSLFTVKTKIIRKAGIGLAVILLVGFTAVASFLKDTKFRDYAAAKLTQTNGAEVNLEELRLSILTGEAMASGMQVTDAANPANNQVAIEKIAANASVYDLLVGRVVLDELLLSDVQFNSKRQTPGEVVAKEPAQPEVFDPCDYEVTAEDIAKIDKYIENAKAVKEWLGKVRKWLPEGDEKAEAPTQKAPIKYLDYLVASADVQPSPRLLAKSALLEKVQIPSAVFGNSTISMENVNDSPAAAALPIKLSVKSNDTPLQIDVTFDYGSRERVPEVSGTFSGLDLSKLQSSLGSRAGLVFKSGLASGQFSGRITRQSVDLKVDVGVENMQADASGDGVLGMGGDTTSEAFKVLKDIKTTIHVVGPTTEPRLAFDVTGLKASIKDALVKAGQERLSEEIDKQIEKQVGDKVPEELKDVLDKPKDLLKNIGDGLLGGKKEEDQ